MQGYKYSIPIEIRVGSRDMHGEKRTVRWKPGQQLETLLHQLRGRQCFALWSELLDDLGREYYKWTPPRVLMSTAKQMSAWQYLVDLVTLRKRWVLKDQEQKMLRM